MLLSDDIQKNINSITSNQIYKVDKGDFEALKKAANIYLQQVGLLSDLYKNAIAKKRIIEKIQSIYSQMRKESKYTQLMLKYQHEFENSLNNFLGRTIYLTYVNKDGTLNYYDDANIGKLYEKATANKGRGNISYGQIFDANDLRQNIKEALKISEMDKKDVYTSAIVRYNQTLQKDYNFEDTPNKGSFYWRLHDYHITGWTISFSNTGPIAEGYARAVINDNSNISNNDIENSLKILYENYIQKDSVGAAIKGDVTFGSDKSIQFAIKEGSFSTAMVGQYMRLAINIQRLPQMSIEDFQKSLPYLIKFGKLVDKIIQVAKNQATEKVREEIREKVGI